jgi:hypothetical protein
MLHNQQYLLQSQFRDQKYQEGLLSGKLFDQEVDNIRLPDIPI